MALLPAGAEPQPDLEQSGLSGFGIPPRQNNKFVQAEADQMERSNVVTRPRGAAAGPAVPSVSDAGLADRLDDMLHATEPAAPQPKEHIWSGTGKAVMSGLAGFGADVLGAGENAAAAVGGEGNVVQQGLHTARTVAQQSAQDWQDQMTPEEQQEMHRQIFSLDPHQTIWQGSTAQVLHSLALQTAQAAPPMLIQLLPAARWMKLGMTKGALAYVGATQAGLSYGQLADNARDEIAQTPANTLLQTSPVYRGLVQSGMDEQAARAELTKQVVEQAPVIGGVLAGVIGATAGRFLSPVFQGATSRLGGMALGAVDQGLQGAALGAAQNVAQETAAHVYDTGRAPTLAGAAHAAGEMGVQGALMGGVLGAGMGGHGRAQPTPVPEHVQTADNSPVNAATGAAPEAHISNTQGNQEYQPIERNREGFETLGQQRGPTTLPSFNEAGQGELPVHADQAAAIRANVGSDVGHWDQQGSGHTGGGAPAEAAPQNPMAGPGGTDMQQVALRQEQLPLQGGQMNAPRPPPGLPVVRGGEGELPLEHPPVMQWGQTRADRLRVRARGAAIPDQPTAEPFKDIRAQILDMNDKSTPRNGVMLSDDNLSQLAGGKNSDAIEIQNQLAQAEKQGRVVTVDNGKLLAKTAKIAASYNDRLVKGEDPQTVIGEATGAGNGKRPGQTMVVQGHTPEGTVAVEKMVEPSAVAAAAAEVNAQGKEPVVTTPYGAIARREAKIANEQGQTRADRLRARAKGEPYRGQGQPEIAAPRPPEQVGAQDITTQDMFSRPGNPEGPGARPTAQIGAELDELHDPSHPRQGVYLDADSLANLQRLGKLDQIRDALGEGVTPVPDFDRQGGVVLARSPEVAREMVALRDQGAGTPQEILDHMNANGPSMEPADVLRRSGQAARENEGLTQQAQAAEAGNVSRRAIERQTGSAPDLEERAKSAVQRDLGTRELARPLGTESAARRLTAEALKVHNEEASRTFARTGIMAPEDVHFATPALDARYSDLHDEYVGAHVMRNTAKTPEEITHAKEGLAIMERRAQVFLRTHAHETGAERIARAAVETNRGAVEEFAKNKKAPGREYAKPRTRIATEHTEPVEKDNLTRGAVRRLSSSDLDTRFQDQLSRRNDKEAELLRRYNESKGLSRTELPRSEKEKYLARVYAGERAYKAVGESRANSDKIAVSPKRTLTEEERAANRERSPGNKITPFKTLDPQGLMATEESINRMEANKGTRAQQRAKADELSKGVTDAVVRGEEIAQSLQGLKREDLESGHNPVLARGYLRQLLQYGRSLHDNPLRSAEAMDSARRYVRLINGLEKLKPTNRAQYLIDAMHGELERQNRRAAGANPERLMHTEELVHGYAGSENVIGGRTEDMRYATKEPRETGTSVRKEIPYAEPPAKIQNKLSGADYVAINAALREANFRSMKLSDLKEKIGDRIPADRVDKAIQQFADEGHGAIRGERMSMQKEQAGESRQYNLEGEDESELRNALGYSQDSRGFHDAAATLAAKFEDDRVLKGHQAIDQLLDNLKKDSPAHKLFTALRRVVDPETLVGYGGDYNIGEKNLAHVSWADSGPIIRLNRDFMERIRQNGNDPHFAMIHAIGHEMAHIATVRAIEVNPALKARLEGILEQVRSQAGLHSHYGLTNVKEMVAEAYSNPKFQKFLDSIEMPGMHQSLWDHFKQLVANILGWHSNPKMFTALDAVMREHGEMFVGKKTPGETTRIKTLNLQDEDGHHVGNMLDRTTSSLGRIKDSLATNSHRALLSAMSPRQMSAQFSKYFGREDGSNPYKTYWDTYFRRNADNAKSMEQLGRISNKWSNAEEMHGPQASFNLSKLIHDATLYQFHPDLGIKDELNNHLTSNEQIARQKEGADTYKALPEELRQQYHDTMDYYAKGLQESSDQIVLNGLHSMLTQGDEASMTPKEFDKTYDVSSIHKLGLNTEEGLQKEFGDRLSLQAVDTLAKVGALPNRRGPYAPLMRDGDYIVHAERSLGTKEFNESKDAQAYLAAQRAKDPTLKVSLRKTEDGAYIVKTVEREVRMAETKSEAAQNQREMAAEYGEENTSSVQLKADLYKGEASITTGSALDKIIRSLDGNKAAQAAVKDFYLRSLGESSFRKHELKRSGVRGVDPGNQHRSLTQYGRAQSYYLSQLRYGRYLANAQGEITQAIREHRDTPDISAVRMGEIAHELAQRDALSRNPYKISELIRKGSAFTQFMMLTSPSHWFVRGVQPYMLSAPWLAARHGGFSDAVAALGRAQNMIASPLVREAAESKLGLSALFSRAAAEKTYSVIDQVMAHIDQTAGDQAAPIKAMIQNLRDNHLIDLSMATELTDIAKGQGTGITGRVMDASRGMLHLAEVNNRVLTAIAARELGLRDGMTEEQAVNHAARAIDVTHNDYSYGNTPRLFMAQAQGLLGGMRPLMFQFMKYPQQVYGLLVSNTLAGLRGKTPAERAIGIKTVMGVLATHMLAAGAIGASLQPIKWAAGALMAGASALGMTDRPYTVAQALSGDTYDQQLREVTNDLFGTDMGELVSKGLPAYLGADMSQRMALASTYQFYPKTDSDEATLGSMVEAVGGPWLNIAKNFWDGAKAFQNGDVIHGLEDITPHIVRDLIKSGAMSQQGVVNNAGTEVIPADKLSGPQLFGQALGFHPETIAETMGKANAEKEALATIKSQGGDLIKQYVAAEPNDRQAVRDQVLAFNKAHPAFGISYSTLQRAVASKLANQREIEQYGIRVRANQRPEIAKYGEAYNTGD